MWKLNVTVGVLKEQLPRRLVRVLQDTRCLKLTIFRARFYIYIRRFVKLGIHMNNIEKLDPYL
jgi:hypothetical protein